MFTIFLPILTNDKSLRAAVNSKGNKKATIPFYFSVISFHHYLVTNIVWALNSTLIKTVYVMCKIYLGVGVPLLGSRRVRRLVFSIRRARLSSSDQPY